MKFITEGDLRDLYKKEPFTAYELEPEARLTPGARQFLADHGIYMFDNDNKGKKKESIDKKQSDKTQESEDAWKYLLLHHKIKSIEALFLLTSEQLLSGNVSLAQNILMLNKQLSCIKNAVKKASVVESLPCNKCTGINQHNFSKSIDDCFEISEFHLQLENGRDILLLHRLRCALQEMEPVLRLISSSSKEKKQWDKLSGKVNQIINSISQLICSLIGGEICLRQT